MAGLLLIAFTHSAQVEPHHTHVFLHFGCYIIFFGLLIKFQKSFCLKNIGIMRYHGYSVPTRFRTIRCGKSKGGRRS